MVKTSVELEKEKVELAKQLGGTTTLKEPLDKALDTYIAHNQGELAWQISLGLIFSREVYPK